MRLIFGTILGNVRVHSVLAETFLCTVTGAPGSLAKSVTRTETGRAHVILENISQPARRNECSISAIRAHQARPLVRAGSTGGRGPSCTAEAPKLFIIRPVLGIF